MTLRGTDGLESGSGIMPLSWLTDFGGVMTRSVPDLADMLNVVTGTDPEDPTTAPADAERPADWRTTLDPEALKGKRIGYIPSTWEDPFGTTGTVEATKAALKYLTDAGATIVEMGTTVGDTNTPPAPGRQPVRQHVPGRLDAVHRRAPGTGRAGLPDPQRGRRQLHAEEGRLRAPGPERLRRRARAADDRGGAHRRRNYRLQYKANAKTWLDTAGADNLGVDAVVYPGLLSDISLNDGGGGKSSFGRRDTPGAGQGIPTVVFPAGVNDNGQPINLQLLGRAWDDDKLVGMAYAFSLLADKDGKGHVAATTAPPLHVRERDDRRSVGGTVPATLSLDARRAGHVRRVHAGRREGVHGADDAPTCSTAGDAALTSASPAS